MCAGRRPIPWCPVQDQPRQTREGEAGLSEEELAGHDVEPLPDREAMSVLRSADVVIPLDPDIAADVLLTQDDEAPAGDG